MYTVNPALDRATRDMFRSFAADEILAKALKEIQKGWHKGNFEGPDGGVCLLGSLNKACTGSATRTEPRHNDGYSKAITLLEQAITDYMAENPSLDIRTFGGASIASLVQKGAIIPLFNDATATGLEDVTMVLKRALHEAEAEGDE